MSVNIKKESRNFALKVTLLHKQLSARKKETVMSEELLRSGAGIGAELAKSEFARDENDRISKIYNAIQNCAETRFWLELLNDSGYLTEFEFNDTLKSCEDLGRILAALIKSLRA